MTTATVDQPRRAEAPPASPRPAVLYLTHRLPHPPDKGDRIRNYHLLRWLSGRAEVHLACLADERPDPDSVAALNALCARVAVVPNGGPLRWARAAGSLAAGGTATVGAFRSPGLRGVVDDWASRTPFLAALASASSLAPYLRSRSLRGVPAVVDLVDVDSRKWLDYAESGRGPRAWLHRLEGRRLARLERETTAWARAVTLVSPAEADLFRRVGGPGPVHAVVNGVDQDYYRPMAPPGGVERGAVFVGALDYPPNVDAAAWFCREVWPEVRRVRPGETVKLVGRRPSSEVRRLADLPGVELVGQVPDVRPHVAGAAVAVAPLRIARGIQNKVLEALAMAKAVVASPEALTGLDVEPGVHALSATSPGGWAGAVLGLLDDPARRSRLGADGRRYVEDRHHWDRCMAPFGPLLGLPPAV